MRCWTAARPTPCSTAMRPSASASPGAWSPPPTAPSPSPRPRARWPDSSAPASRRWSLPRLHGAGARCANSCSAPSPRSRSTIAARRSAWARRARCEAATACRGRRPRTADNFAPLATARLAGPCLWRRQRRTGRLVRRARPAAACLPLDAKARRRRLGARRALSGQAGHLCRARRALGRAARDRTLSH